MIETLKKHTTLIVFLTIVMFFAPAAMLSAGVDQRAEQAAVKYRDIENRAIEIDEVQRQQWSLSVEEWHRYKTLMRGIRGSISPANISPIEVLGTHARNDQERKKYAEIWAKMRFEDAERILAFQNAYNDAFSRLYGDTQLIDIGKIKRSDNQRLSMGPHDRLLVFVKIDQCSACKQMVRRIVNDQALMKSQTDIYFIDTKPGRDEGEMRQWAVELNIDKARLHTGNITMNHDQGNLLKITKKVINQVPVAFKLDANSITAIKL